MIKKISVLLVLQVLMLAGFTLQAQQEEEEGWAYYQDEELDFVFLTTKRIERTQETALNIRVLTREDIERWGFQTLYEVFEFLENGFTTYKGRDNVIGVRGIMGYANDKIKFLIDGFELPFFLGLGSGEFPVTLDEVKRIEIVKGPNTSIWGGNATQATVNVIRFNGADFQGTRVGVAAGEWGHRRGWIHHAAAPTSELNYDVYFSGMYQDGWDLDYHAWGGEIGGGLDTVFQAHDRNTPLPDHELIAGVNYRDFHMIYRRVEGAHSNKGDHNANRNYTDAFGLEKSVYEFLGNPDLNLTINLELSAFGQEYDQSHQPLSDHFVAFASGIQEHKAEKRLEWDAHVHYNPEADWDILAGFSGNYWRAESTPWGGYSRVSGEFPAFGFAPNIAQGIVSDEYFPSFTEVNDLANWEFWADWKMKATEQVSIVLGGRYVYDFEPDDQLRTSDSPSALYRTDRELLRDFFPKAAVVWSPKENMSWKLIYSEGFNRPNTNEQFSMTKTIESRGRLEATTAQTLEGVLEWQITPELNTLLAVFNTQIDDFVNFVYTGPGPFPFINPGDAIGFYNVGDRELQGLEWTLEYETEQFGGLISLGLMDQNEIVPLARFDERISASSGGSGSTGIIDNTDLNKQSYPEWTGSVGLWVKPLENLQLSLLYKTHQNVKNNYDSANYGLTLGQKVIAETSYDRIDLVLNYKNMFSVENLNFQLIAQNVTDENDLVGSALDPVHSESIEPRYIQGKVSYLFA